MVAPDGLVAFDGDEVAALACETSVELGGRHFDGLALGEACGGLAYGGEYHGEVVVELVLKDVEDVLFVFVDVVPEGLALVEGQRLDFLAELFDGEAVGLGGLGDVGAHFVYFGAELVVGEGGKAGAFFLDFGYDGTYGFEVSAGFIAEDFGYYAGETHFFRK